MDTASCVFEPNQNKNWVSWNSIIGDYAGHGLAARAQEELDRMEKAGVKPDEVIVVNVPLACVHTGLVEESEKQFTAMVTKYGIQAEKEHYTCMGDLYGIASQLDKVEKLIEGMPFKPDVVLWDALFAACRLHLNVELGEFAARKICELEKSHLISYYMLSKIKGEKGIRSNVNELIDMMNEREIRK